MMGLSTVFDISVMSEPQQLFEGSNYHSYQKKKKKIIKKSFRLGRSKHNFFLIIAVVYFNPKGN
jgi:hypothetical protein